MNYLIYLVYGGKEYSDEALYSLLTYYKFNTGNDIKVVVYTDNADYFKDRLPNSIIYIELTPDKLKEWKGEVNFNHRIKVKTLQDACQRFTGNILYVDTDTCYTKNILPLFDLIAQGEILFHLAEGRLIDDKGGIARKMRNFLKKHSTFILPSVNEPVKMDDTLAVWNAGSIGFKTDFSDSLQPVLELTDAMYNRYRLFIMEQVAFNYFFQKISLPKSTDAFIGHYCYFKEFRIVLNEFFEHYSAAGFEELVANTHKVDPIQLSAEKRAYKNMNFWQKQRQKLSKGRKWKIADYKL